MGKMHLTLKQSWEQVKEKLKENDHRLTDEDLVYDPADTDALLERLAQKLNRTKVNSFIIKNPVNQESVYIHYNYLPHILKILNENK